MNPEFQQEIAKVTNPEKLKGTLADALVGADVFIGVSAPHIVTTEMISKMNKDSIVMFFCQNEKVRRGKNMNKFLNTVTI